MIILSTIAPVITYRHAILSAERSGFLPIDGASSLKPRERIRFRIPPFFCCKDCYTLVIQLPWCLAKGDRTGMKPSIVSDYRSDITLPFYTNVPALSKLPLSDAEPMTCGSVSGISWPFTRRTRLARRARTGYGRRGMMDCRS